MLVINSINNVSRLFVSLNLGFYSPAVIIIPLKNKNKVWDAFLIKLKVKAKITVQSRNPMKTQDLYLLTRLKTPA